MPAMRTLAASFCLAAACLSPAAADAGLVLSQAIVDIAPGAPVAQDIEVWNDGSEVAYVVAQPAEIVSPGLPGEKRVPVEDPGVGGLLVSPQKMILQPDERKLIRVAAVAARGDKDRIWRVTIKPVAGPVTAEATALKVLLGYDVLVIYRPAALSPSVTGERSATGLMLRNTGNTNLEIYEGKVCPAPNATQCTTLPSRRLYPGQAWQQPLAVQGSITYRISSGSHSSVQQF